MEAGHGMWGTVIGAIVVVAGIGFLLKNSSGINKIVSGGVNPSISKVEATFSSKGTSLGG